MPNFDAKTRAKTQFRVASRQQTLATQLRVAQARHKNAVNVETQSGSEAQSGLETLPKKYSQRRFQTGQAYDMHIAVWGDGNEPTLDMTGDARASDILDPDVPAEKKLRPYSSPPPQTQVSRTLHALSTSLEAHDRQLSGDEKALIEELHRRDQHVRAHERAPMAQRSPSDATRARGGFGGRLAHNGRVVSPPLRGGQDQGHRPQGDPRRGRGPRLPGPDHQCRAALEGDGREAEDGA